MDEDKELRIIGICILLYMALVYIEVTHDDQDRGKIVFIYVSPLHLTGDIISEAPPNSYIDEDGVLRYFPLKRAR